MSKLQINLMIITVALAIFMANLDTSIVNVALPTLATHFHADPADVAKVILAYLLAMSSSLLLFGRLGDLKGSNRLFVVGYGIFTLGSILCALSATLDYLIASRLLQGIGGAILLSNWGSIIVKHLPPQARAKAFGAITIAAGSGFAVGPPIGGLLIDVLNWRWIFLINIPFGLAAMIASWAFFASQKQKTAPGGRMDVPGALFSILMLVSLFYLFEAGPLQGWTAPVTLATISALALFFVLLLLRESRAASPLVRLSLFRNRNLSLSFLSRMLVLLIMSGLNFLFPFFFEGVRGLQPSTVGLLLMIFPLTSFIGGPFAGSLGAKTSMRLVGHVASVLLLIACPLIWSFSQQTSWPFIIAAFIIYGIGLALFMTGNVSLVMSHAPHGNEGMVTALISVVTTVGSALGISVAQMLYSRHLPVVHGSADHLHASVEALSNGYHHATLVTIVAAGFVFVFSFFVREKSRPIDK